MLRFHFGFCVTRFTAFSVFDVKWAVLSFLTPVLKVERDKIEILHILEDKIEFKQRFTEIMYF